MEYRTPSSRSSREPTARVPMTAVNISADELHEAWRLPPPEAGLIIYFTVASLILRGTVL
jgi:hypothetical protein